MKQIMSTEAIKEKLENEAPVVVANDHVYWYFYNDECENELTESPIEWLETPWNASRMTIAVYSNTCSSGFNVAFGGDENIITIHGHKKIHVTITGEENLVESENENVLVCVVEDYNYHNYIHGVFLKEVCGFLYDMDTSRYQLRISNNQMCQIIANEDTRAGIWNCWTEEIIDQGDCQAHYLDDWFPVEARFSKRSNKSF